MVISDELQAAVDYAKSVGCIWIRGGATEEYFRPDEQLVMGAEELYQLMERAKTQRNSSSWYNSSTVKELGIPEEDIDKWAEFAGSLYRATR